MIVPCMKRRLGYGRKGQRTKTRKGPLNLIWKSHFSKALKQEGE